MSPNTNTKTDIFITGATNAHTLNFTALVRSLSKAQKLNKFGINTVLGSYGDSALVEDLAASSDVVLSLADADHLSSVQAILRGLERRNKTTGKVPILIHNSGTGVLGDNAAGEYATTTIYDDTNLEQLDSLSETQLHRNIELEVINADKQGYVRTYMISPSVIYGIVSNKFVTEGGLQNPFSIQIPYLVDAALDRGGPGGMVGQGKNMWPNVHILDVAELYTVLYDSIITNPTTTGHGREGIYFAEGGEHTFYDIGKAIGESLVELGKGTSRSREPTTFTQFEMNKYFNGYTFFGSNSRCRGTRSRAIGWQPKYTTKDMLESIKGEVEAAAFGKRGPIVLLFPDTVPN